MQNNYLRKQTSSSEPDPLVGSRDLKFREVAAIKHH
jgi:hypothetical protein